VEGGTNNSRCPYGVPTTKLSKMQDVYAFLGKILFESTNKVEYLERENLKIEEKITRMCFHMHVLKITAKRSRRPWLLWRAICFCKSKLVILCKILYKFVVSPHSISGVSDSLLNFPS
jgi:hypothetical protein